jgi:outer membrane protein, heavy metal efflux system
MRIIIIALILPVFLYGVNLQECIAHAKNSRLSLKAIQQKIKSLEYKYETTKNFSDPVIALSMNDIHFDHPADRNLEAMQFTALTLKQKIPYFGKRAANGKVVQDERLIAQMDLQAAVIRLVRDIKLIAFTIWQKKELLHITKRYSALLHQNINLYLLYNKSNSKAYIQLLNAKLLLSELRIERENLSASLQTLYAELGYLSDMQIKKLSFTPNISPPKPLQDYLMQSQNNSALHSQEAALKTANAQVKVKELAKRPDPFIEVGYYHRERFADYASIGIGLSLPIYGTQNLQEEQAKCNALSKSSKLSDMRLEVRSKIKQAYWQLQNAYAVYMILNKESLPQVTALQAAGQTQLTTRSDLFAYTDVLAKSYKLQKQKIIAMGEFEKRLAQLESLIGASK